LKCRETKYIGRYAAQYNDKQRFAITERDGKKYIRANQGHTIQVENLDLKKVESPDEIKVAVHGTCYKVWPSIKKDGLSRMKRNHIHLARGILGDEHVISGMRQSSELLVYINTEKAMKDGIEFFISENGVILTPGDKSGYIPPKYFEKVISSKTGNDVDFSTPSPLPPNNNDNNDNNNNNNNNNNGNNGNNNNSNVNNDNHNEYNDDDEAEDDDRDR